MGAYPLSIGDRSDQPITIQGSVYNIINGSRIHMENILINMTDTYGNLIKISDNMDEKNKGVYTYAFEDTSLNNGNYKI